MAVVVADDAGLVRLLNYPSVVKHAPGYGHRGHASHIERVAFLSGNYRVISCGGHDTATYQWKIRGPDKPPAPDKATMDLLRGDLTQHLLLPEIFDEVRM